MPIILPYLKSPSFPGLFSAEERIARPLLGGEKPWERGCLGLVDDPAVSADCLNSDLNNKIVVWADKWLITMNPVKSQVLLKEPVLQSYTWNLVGNLLAVERNYIY